MTGACNTNESLIKKLTMIIKLLVYPFVTYTIYYARSNNSFKSLEKGNFFLLSRKLVTITYYVSDYKQAEN